MDRAPAKSPPSSAPSTILEDLGSTEINARYFAAGTDNLKMLGTAGRLVSAWL